MGLGYDEAVMMPDKVSDPVFSWPLTTNLEYMRLQVH